MNRQEEEFEDTENRTVTGQTNPTARTDKLARPAKGHQDYWKPKLKKRSYMDRSGERVLVPEWQVRMFHAGKEAWFNLGTSNQAAAALKARDIYLSVLSVGWEATLTKYKPSPMAKAEVCSVGEFLADIRSCSHLKPMTIRRYAVKLRKMISDIAKLDAGMKKKEKKARYDYMNGGHKAWLANVDKQPLNVLTQETVNAWRNSYVAKAGAGNVERKSAERSAASYFRCVRALFAPDVVSTLKVKLPSVSPFEGVKIKDPGPQRYHSDVNPDWLLACANRELEPKDRNQYLALILCLWAGLRRKEADLLLWEQVDFAQSCINVSRTEYFEPKTEESIRAVDMPDEVMDVLRSFKEGSTSAFVLNGSEPDPNATYDYYRCDCTWRSLNDWLKGKGIRQRKAIHALRKESGSLIASEYGIEAARQHLGHRDIGTTSAHYVGKKKRIKVGLSINSANMKASAS